MMRPNKWNNLLREAVGGMRDAVTDPWVLLATTWTGILAYVAIRIIDEVVAR